MESVGQLAPTSWSSAGLDRLTLDPNGNRLDVVGPFVGRLRAVASTLPVPVDPLSLLAERAAIAGLRGRRSTGGGGAVDGAAQSVGGTAWVVAASDGWFCINLARQDDAAALPALLEDDVDHRNWDAVLAAFRQRSLDELDHRSMLLGLPASRVPGGPIGSGATGDPQIAFRHGQRLTSPFLVTDHGPASFAEQPLVVDLTSLWAGPLCGALLAASGCRVIKVEGRRRPDGARSGPSEFFDLLNANKECIALDFGHFGDQQVLRELLSRADVVLEGSRPRVMESLGIDPHDHVKRWSSSWVSVTAFGRTGPWSNRVGFGDDVAAGAGVVSQSPPEKPGEPPRFVGDAMADPVGGIFAASAAWNAIEHKRSVVVDVALREALGYAWGATSLVIANTDPVTPSEPRRSAVRAQPFDANGDRIRQELGS